MKILIVSSYLPFPLHNGGHIRLFNLIKELSKRHAITLICEKRSHQRNDDISKIAKFCEEVITIDRKKQWSIKNIVSSGSSVYPFLLTGHVLPEMKQKIVSTLHKKRFDLIHVETFYVFQNLPKTYLPTVLVEHNIEYEVYERYERQAKIFLRPFLFLDIAKIRYWEKKYWSQSTKLVAVSISDQEKMLPISASLVPNGVDLQSFPFKKSKLQKKEKRILFIGDFKWIQNTTAAVWILNKIWPSISTGKEANMKLWIVGKHIPESIKAYKSKNVLIDENAPDDTAKIYDKSFILLAPITVGGGSSYKILEAMASGVPVVTTNLGAQGIGARDKKEMLIGDNTEDLVENIQTLFTNPNLYNGIAQEARNLIEKKYSWVEISKLLEKVYEEALIL